MGRETRGRPEPAMSVARSVADVLRDHVVLELEAIDRMYLNVYVPHLQTAGAVVGYLHVHRGQRFASTTAVVPMSEAFFRASLPSVAVSTITHCDAGAATFFDGQR